MAGELVPLVLLPRYTTLASGAYELTTTPIDVTPYSQAIVTLWRGAILGTAPVDPSYPTMPIEMAFEGSTDQNTWFPETDFLRWVPGENAQLQVTLDVPRRWLRLRVHLYAADNVVSCWAIGFLEKRLP